MPEPSRSTRFPLENSAAGSARRNFLRPQGLRTARKSDWLEILPRQPGNRFY